MLEKLATNFKKQMLNKFVNLGQTIDKWSKIVNNIEVGREPLSFSQD